MIECSKLSQAKTRRISNLADMSELSFMEYGLRFLYFEVFSHANVILHKNNLTVCLSVKG